MVVARRARAVVGAVVRPARVAVVPVAVEYLDVDDLTVDHIEDQHPGPRRIEQHIPVPWPVRPVRLWRCVKALAEVVTATTARHHAKHLYLRNQRLLAFGDERVTKLPS